MVTPEIQAARERLSALAHERQVEKSEAQPAQFDPTVLFSGITPKSAEEINGWIWSNEIVPRLRESGLPSRHWKDIRGNWQNHAQETVYNRCKDLCTGVGAIVALVGTRGAGKTTIAAQIAIERAWNELLPPWERQPPYRKLNDLISRFKPLYADFGSIDTETLIAGRENFCRSCSLVTIDEIHECDDQRIKDRVLTDILDRRYAWKRDTIIISNQTPADFVKTTSDSVRSRISEHGMIIPCNWESWRSKP